MAILVSEVKAFDSSWEASALLVTSLSDSCKQQENRTFGHCVVCRQGDVAESGAALTRPERSWAIRGKEELMAMPEFNEGPCVCG
ncbi:hypothetical protein [Streptomyces flaveus]|uniref:hypothetical protein n=1 Tax=Streptomyces flaveus TaxID=66370 RepID=UPI00332FCA42